MNKRVLVVDDEPEILDVTKFIIEDAGYEAVTAASGQEAINLLTSNKFDLVISDIRMPLMDGIKLLREVRRQKISVPFILSSGFSDYTRQEMFDMGASDFIPKPTTADRIVESIEKILRP